MALYTTNRIVEYSVWLSNSNQVTNQQSGYDGCHGNESTIRYGSFAGYTTQTFSTNNDVVICGDNSTTACSQIDNTAFTVELLFKWDSSSVDPCWLFSKGHDFYIAYSKSTDTLWVHRDINYGGYKEEEEWSCHPGITTNGKWYDLQVAWGGYNSTPLVKCNNVSKTMTHYTTSRHGGNWYDDSNQQIKVMNSSDQNACARSVLSMFRFHNAVLSDAHMSDNYTADLVRTAINVTWTQDGTTFKVPNTVATHVNPDSVIVVANAWRETNVPNTATTPYLPTVAIQRDSQPVGGNAVAAVILPTVTVARFADVPPPPTFVFTEIVRNTFTLTPKAGDE